MAIIYTETLYPNSVFSILSANVSGADLFRFFMFVVGFCWFLLLVCLGFLFVVVFVVCFLLRCIFENDEAFSVSIRFLTSFRSCFFFCFFSFFFFFFLRLS